MSVLQGIPQDIPASIKVRPSQERGHIKQGWLDTYHSFSFGHYYDEAHMGFRDLRVINDDVIKPSSGFPTHGHEDMEIITYIVRGKLSHKDSTGGVGIISRGEVQTMSAGKGVQHSEFNASPDEDVRLLQIWILPQSDGLTPAYAQADIPVEEKHNALRLIAAPQGAGSLPINQDARIYASVLDVNAHVEHKLKRGRGAWVQIIEGSIDLNGVMLNSGDGAAVEGVEDLHLRAHKDSEFLLFDLS